MKIEYKLVLSGKGIRILPICNIIDYDMKIIYFSGEDETNKSHQTAKTYRRRLKLEGFGII